MSSTGISQKYVVREAVDRREVAEKPARQVDQVHALVDQLAAAGDGNTRNGRKQDTYCLRVDRPDTGYSSIEALPSAWLFSHERIQELLFPQPASAIPMPAARRGPVAVEMRSKAADRAHEDMREAVLTA